MKKIIAILAFVMAGTASFAQNDAISKFFNKYSDDQSFSQVNVSSKMFSLFTNIDMDNPEDKEVVNAISKLKGLRILAKDDSINARKLYKEAYSLIPKGQYEELMSVRDKDKDMKFLIKESGGKISELLMIAGGSKEFMILSLFGEIDLKQVSKIGKSMDIDGLKNLEKIDEKKKN